MPRTPCRHQFTTKMNRQLCISPASAGERGWIGKTLTLGSVKEVAITGNLNH